MDFLFGFIQFDYYSLKRKIQFNDIFLSYQYFTNFAMIILKLNDEYQNEYSFNWNIKMQI